LAAPNRFSRWLSPVLAVLLVSAAVFAVVRFRLSDPGPGPEPAPDLQVRNYRPRVPLDSSGFFLVVSKITPWAPGASLGEISATWKTLAHRLLGLIDQALARPGLPANRRIELLVLKAQCYNYEGQPRDAYRVLAEGRALIEADDAVAEVMLFTWIFFQGVTGLSMRPPGAGPGPG
jgi:hypothetical protein